MHVCQVVVERDILVENESSKKEYKRLEKELEEFNVILLPQYAALYEQWKRMSLVTVHTHDAAVQLGRKQRHTSDMRLNSLACIWGEKLRAWHLPQNISSFFKPTKEW